jgi:hypothetical protein
MAPSSTKEDVVVRLLEGRSNRRELVLQGGHSRPPFTVGNRGEWCVDAGRVAAVHVMLAFNGAELYVRAIPGATALLDGVPLDGRWVVASMPSELRFGRARIVIRKRQGAAAREVVVSAAARSLRSLAADQVTCVDEERLQSALRLATLDTEVSGGDGRPLAAVLKRSLVLAPLPPLRRPSTRAVAPPARPQTEGEDEGR